MKQEPVPVVLVPVVLTGGSYPDTCKLFYTYHMQLIKDSLEYLRKLKNTMISKIIYFDGLPANLIKNAGETDFKTKNKGR
jgi:hypothetical protein